MNDKELELAVIKESWRKLRWYGIKRDYTAEDVCRLRGSFWQHYPLAQRGADKLWDRANNNSFIRALGASTGHMAVEMVNGGLKAIYCSGWQVAGDANTNGQTYPDQSLYSVDSVPKLVRRINNALLAKDLVQKMTEKGNVDWMVPIVADAD